MSELFVTAVEEIYRAATEPSRWPQALQAIADCLDDVGAILIFVKDDGTFGVLNSHSLDDIIEEYGKYWNAHDLRAVRARERGYFLNRDIITDRDILSEEEMKTEPFYADFLARYGLKYFAAVMVSPDARIEVAVSVQRAIGKPAYTESELALLARLGPHIERSLRLSIRLMDSELSKLGLGAALARVGIGVFVLDAVGRVLFSNPAAQAMLGDGLELIDNRLTARSTATNVQASDAIKQIVKRKPDDWLNEIRPILIQRRSSPRPLALSVLPIPVATSALNQLLAQARVSVLVIDPDHDSSLDPSLIRDIFGVTLGEARLTALIGTGQSPREAAKKLGISEETARGILKRVFAKIGVSRQSELTALLSKLVLRA